MMTLGPRALHLGFFEEGCRLHAYRDTGGIWTIGRGATGPGIGPGTVWTQAQADAEYIRRMNQFATWTWALVHDVPTTPEQFGALNDACYNAGPGNLKKSPMIAMHRAGDDDAAARAFLPWHLVDHAGNPEPGLPKRRAAEAALFRGDLATFDQMTGYRP